MPVRFYFLTFWAGLGLLAGCQRAEPIAAETAAPDEVSVTLAPVRRQRVAQPIETSGQLSSETEARLSFKIGGIVRRVLVEEGQSVRENQLLAVLDLTEIGAQVAQAEQSQAKTARDLTRFSRLLADSAAPLEAVQNLRTAAAVAREQLRIARFNQRFSEIRAPVAGRIVRKLLSAGELAAPGTPVLFMTATGPDAWTLRAGVADKDWARLRVGDPATVRLDAYPGRAFRGRVSRRAAGADLASGTWQIDVQVTPQPDAPLATGLFAQATLRPRQQAEYRVIPATALVEGDGLNAYVFAPPRAKGGPVRRLPIRIAFLDGGQVYVRAGLDSVPQVVAAGAGFLTEYSTINE